MMMMMLVIMLTKAIVISIKCYDDTDKEEEDAPKSNAVVSQPLSRASCVHCSCII